jgi:cyanophycinase-like exopeptidase
MNDQLFPEPGLIILFGSGETSPTGRKIFEHVILSLPKSPRLALLETPAGFELNSHQVINRVGDFFTHRLQNYSPKVEIIPARKRSTHFSPDNPEIVAPLLNADLIFMGPGSPSYAIRQLRDSLAWYYLIARHRLGAALALASAATVAFSACALPVYEIYKVGEDVHWNEGLDFFHQYGLQLVFIPHWNNHEGGAELDTSRCFMGQERFARLMDLLPDEMTIIGLDEKTALVMDPAKCECSVSGLGIVTLIHTGHKHTHNNYLHPTTGITENFKGTKENLAEITKKRGGHVHLYQDGQKFPMSEIGSFHPYHPEACLPPSIWQQAIQANELLKQENISAPSEDVLQLIHARDETRKHKDWIGADELRKQIEMLGWELSDTKDGPVLRKLSMLDSK